MLTQLEVCSRFDTEFVEAPLGSTVGVSENIGSSTMPMNGMRINPLGNSSGWFLWQGEELSQADDFFTPLHTSHLCQRCPSVVKYLGLPPGWRFLITLDYEDVWFDPTLLESSPETGASL